MNTGIFRKEAMSKFLRADAPGALVSITPPAGLVVIGAMAALTVALTLLVIFGRAQVVAEGRGIVRSDQPPIILHAPFDGTVLAVRHGVREEGHSGDPLIELDVRREAAAHEKCAAELGVEQKDLAGLEHRLADWNGAKEQNAAMALVLITQIRAQREKLSGASQRCDALGTRLERSRVAFPADALVLDLAVGPGSVVHEGEVLATLRPAGAHAVGYVVLPEAYRSEVAVGQVVQVKFDALPFDEVGAGSARVTRLLEALPSWVKLDATEGGVFAELSLDTMPAGARHARTGMTFTADVLTRRPRIAALLFSGGLE